MAPRSRVDSSKRSQVIRRDGHGCYLCDRMCVVYRGERLLRPNSLTIDHVVPLSRGGSNHLGNLAVCCYQCNQLKGNLPAHAVQGNGAPLLAGLVRCIDRWRMCIPQRRWL